MILRAAKTHSRPRHYSKYILVAAGDSLKSLAQKAYANSSLWYVLAAANALSGDADLVAGTQLKVPGVDVSKNDATTFKPYNPNEIIGSTAPGLPYIPPQPKSGCSALATIIRVVVAVVLAYVAPQIGYAMLIAGAGETVAQTVEIKQGYREQYNVGAIVVAVASAAIPNGGTTAWGKIGIAAMRAAGNYATSYLVNMALGIQDSFSWRGVATAAVTAAISQAAFGNLPTETAAAQSATGSMVSATAAFSWSRVAQAAVVAVKEAGKSIVRSGISYAVEKAIVGESHWNWGQVLSSAAVQAGSAFAGTYRETGIAKSQKDSELTQSYNSTNASVLGATLPSMGYGLHRAGAIYTDENAAGVASVSSSSADEQLHQLDSITVQGVYNEDAGGFYTWNWSAMNPGWNYSGQFVKGDRPVQYSRPEGRYTGQHGRPGGAPWGPRKNGYVSSISNQSDSIMNTIATVSAPATIDGRFFKINPGTAQSIGLAIGSAGTTVDIARVAIKLSNPIGVWAHTGGQFPLMFNTANGVAPLFPSAKTVFEVAKPGINYTTVIDLKNIRVPLTAKFAFRSLPAVGIASELLFQTNTNDNLDIGHLAVNATITVGLGFLATTAAVPAAIGGALWFGADTAASYYEYNGQSGWRALGNSISDKVQNPSFYYYGPKN